MLFTSFFKHLTTQEIPDSNSREKHLYVSCFLLHFFRALAASQQNRAQSRILYLCYLTFPYTYVTLLPGAIFGWKSSAVAMERSFFSLYHTSVQLKIATLYQNQLPKSPLSSSCYHKFKFDDFIFWSANSRFTWSSLKSSTK